MNIGDSFFVQYTVWEEIHREELQVRELDKKQVVADVQNCKKTVKKMSKTSIIVSVPNSSSKAELIVQKLTEIGVDSIYFRNTQRSQWKFSLEKKRERFETIIKEAVEQSRWRSVPSLEIISLLEDIQDIKQLIVCDTLQSPWVCPYMNINDLKHEEDIHCLIWPEGWRGSTDYEVIKMFNPFLLTLGETVLRMETAAIVAAWYCKNL